MKVKEGERMKFWLLKKEKGITLIALVITIIVLLILAGVSIATLTGDNGILTKASEAKEKTEIASEKEMVELAIADANMKGIENGKITKESLQKALNAQLGENKAEVYDDGYGNYTIKINNTNRDYEVSRNGAIIVAKQVKDENPGVLSGGGTEENPYLIESMEDFIYFSNEIKEGTTYSEQYIELNCDLDFSNPASYVNSTTKEFGDINKNGKEEELLIELTTGRGFYGVGVENDEDRENKSFKGVFKGNYHTINHLYINKKKGENFIHVGLFNVNFGTISGIELKNVNINCNSNVGICCGGIVGNNKGKIQECSCSGNINLISDGNKTSLCGGITGNNNTDGKIYNCFNLSNILTKKMGSEVNYNGGIAGQCFNSVIENCYNNGNISTVHTSENAVDIGGITGSVSGSSIKNCYNTGKISLKSENAVNIFKGSLCGYIYSNGSISNSYYIANEGIGGIGYSEGTTETILGKSEDELKNACSFLGDAFKEDRENINNGYPIFTWQ